MAKTCPRQLMAATVLVPLLMAAAAGAAAAPVYSINGTLTLDGIVQQVAGSEPTGIADGRSDAFGVPGAAVTGDFGALAQPGELGSRSSVAALAPGGSIGGSADAISTMTLDNIQILKPGVAAGTPVNYSINFTIDGSIVVSAFGDSSAQAVVLLTYLPTPGNGMTLGEVTASTIPGDSVASGIFSSGVRHVTASTPIQTGFNDNDVFAEFTLATQAGASAGPSANEQGQASADSDFFDPFSFPIDGPVFNFFDPNTGLPVAGFTAESGDGCIVNNRFVCGVASVPEPSSLLVVVAALTGVALLRRRDTSRESSRCAELTRGNPKGFGRRISSARPSA